MIKINSTTHLNPHWIVSFEYDNSATHPADYKLTLKMAKNVGYEGQNPIVLKSGEASEAFKALTSKWP